MPYPAPFTVTRTQRKELDQVARTHPNPRVRTRALMVLGVADGRPRRQLAPTFRVDRQTISTWVERYRAEGRAGLADRPRTGRPPTLTSAIAEDLKALACETPSRYGHVANTWNAGLLARQLADRWGVTLSDETVRRHLHRLNLHYRSPKLHLHSPDPEYREKRGASRA